VISTRPTARGRSVGGVRRNSRSNGFLHSAAAAYRKSASEISAKHRFDGSALAFTNPFKPALWAVEIDSEHSEPSKYPLRQINSFGARLAIRSEIGIHEPIIAQKD
jgi:hypothetical protein